MTEERERRYAAANQVPCAVAAGRIHWSGRWLALLYRPILRRTAYNVLQGRRIDPEDPAAGRFLRSDVDSFLKLTRARLELVLADAQLEKLPTLGNRNNVLLAALTIAAYQSLLEMQVQPAYAIQLFADMGWRIYERMISVPGLIARIARRDPQRRMDLMLRAFLRFPFSAPGRPGYEVQAWSDSEGFHTHWTWCPPVAFVRQFVERHGDRGEFEAFYQSWCLYDWPAADVMAGEIRSPRRHYARRHTLSRGDSVCDMCWTAGGCVER